MDIFNHIETICTSPGDGPPAPVLLALDPGPARADLVDYMVERYQRSAVLPFQAGPDTLIEVCSGNSLNRMYDAFDIIEDASVYANSAFDGVILMDISDLPEGYLSEFKQCFEKTCAHASVIFVLPSAPTRTQLRLAETLKLGFPTLRSFCPPESEPHFTTARGGPAHVQ